GFGNRMHPILGYSAFHKGVDFGAPSGTPIQAAGDGIVEQKGWNGGYGNYLRIRHAGGEYATAYAHLSRFASGIADGASSAASTPAAASSRWIRFKCTSGRPETAPARTWRAK
ncbi:MAG: M23 family metallopeptidase, partial [Opitutaceae bacterium]